MLVAASDYARGPFPEVTVCRLHASVHHWPDVYVRRILSGLRQDPFSVHCPGTLAEMNIPRSNV
jgi:hypothetical protein